MSRVVALAVGAVALLSACTRQTGAPASIPATAPTTGQKISVVTSFYPLYEFAARIGGEDAAVRRLVPAGAEPHDYEPTPQDLTTLHAARLLIYNGAGFEPWIERLAPTLPPSVEQVEATAGLPLASGESEGDRGSAPAAPAARGRRSLDSHVWVDPLLAEREVDNIAAGFMKVNPQRRATYEANAARLRADLQALHGRFVETLRDCRLRVFITNHAAFGYLAARYRLTVVPISGLSPESEPSAARLKAVIKTARRYGVRVIYFETLVSPRVAQTIAREVGAQARMLNPLEGLTDEELRQGKTYFTVMDENRRALAEGLDCR